MIFEKIKMKELLEKFQNQSYPERRLRKHVQSQNLGRRLQRVRRKNSDQDLLEKENQERENGNGLIWKQRIFITRKNPFAVP